MRLIGSFFIGSAGFVGVAFAVAWLSNVSTPADAARVDPELRLEAAAPAVDSFVMDEPSPAPVRTVMDIRNYYASGEIAQPYGWLFNPEIMPVRPAIVAAIPVPAPVSEPTVETVSAVPLPESRPLSSGRVMSDGEPDDVLTLAPRPPRRPDFEAEIAALPPTLPEDVEVNEPSPPPAAIEAPKDGLRYPTAEDKFAVYDIRAKKVYLPGGKKLEAHSGYGDKFDDPRHIAVKMEGPTPPNRYRLHMREALFHGVEAIRMTPIGDGKMYGRNGFLVHSYLLGPRGDSNGCVSIRDYDVFLNAFKRGELKEIIVVESMPKSAEPMNPLMSWIMGKTKKN